MPYKSLITQECFWKFLRIYEEMKERQSLEKIKRELSIDHRQWSELSALCCEIGLNLKLEDNQLLPASENLALNIELRLSEWLALQSTLNNIVTDDGAEFAKIKEQGLESFSEGVEYTSLLNVLKNEAKKQEYFQERSHQHHGALKTLEESTQNKAVLEITLKDHKVFDLYTHRLVFLDGELCVVGEDISDRCLVYFPIEELSNLKKLEKIDYQANFSSLEVNDFIFAIRAITGNEERLVLKIKNQESINLTPAYHFLGNPFITSNLEGDLIWAASIETSSDLYDWLYSMKDQIEILDPKNLREDFEAFCQFQKNRESKAS
jgi:hypothetical protein